MKFLKRCLPVLSLAGLMLLAFPGVAHADVNDFTITDFHADETLTRADPQGELHIVETIKVTFTDNNHGIERAIPETYKGKSLHFHLNQVTSDSGAPTEISTRHENGNLVLRIGDPDRTVTGAQEYTIDYTLDNVISFYKDHDELYWDVNGDQWQQPTAEVTATVNLPDGVKLAADKPVCYAGAYGSEQRACIVTVQGNQLHASATLLNPQTTLTYVLGFQKGFFTPPTFWDNLREHALILTGLLGLPLLGFAVGFTWWWRKGRDEKGRGTIVPEYAPPAGLSPLQAGTIADFKVDNRDLTATIIDLARRGYIRIIETKKDRLILKDQLSYTLELKQTDLTQLDGYETELLQALFDPFEAGTITELGKYNAELGKTARALRKSVTKVLTADGYFKANPHRTTFSLSSLWVVAWLGVIFFGNAHVPSLWPLIVGTVIAIIILGIFISLLPARTAKGVAAREQLLGLKMYMETAEKDRLEKLEGPDAAYAAKTGEPARTVEFFEKLLPYAIVLGVETQWAAQFKDIYTNPPDWYAGSNLTAFNAGYLAGALNSGLTPAMNSSFTAPSSSSGSGFSGGGFSGGGGGGGGGGGW